MYITLLSRRYEVNHIRRYKIDLTDAARAIGHLPVRIDLLLRSEIRPVEPAFGPHLPLVLGRGQERDLLLSSSAVLPCPPAVPVLARVGVCLHTSTTPAFAEANSPTRLASGFASGVAGVDLQRCFCLLTRKPWFLYLPMRNLGERAGSCSVVAVEI